MKKIEDSLQITIKDMNMVTISGEQTTAKDIVIMHGDKKEEYSKGTLKDWANDVGQYTKDIYGVLEAIRIE